MYKNEFDGFISHIIYIKKYGGRVHYYGNKAKYFMDLFRTTEA
jgi:hypothetical protein